MVCQLPNGSHRGKWTFLSITLSLSIWAVLSLIQISCLRSLVMVPFPHIYEVKSISFLFGHTSPGGSVNSGLRSLVAGRPTRGTLCQALSDLCQGPAESRVPHWAKAITNKLMLSISKLRTNISYLKCLHLVSAPSLVTLPLGVTIIIFCLILI